MSSGFRLAPVLATVLLAGTIVRAQGPEEPPSTAPAGPGSGSGAATTAPAAAAPAVTPLPLGASLANRVGDQYYSVYVPTRYGGVLTVKTTSGAVNGIVGPDGKLRANGSEIGTDQHGWHFFQVVGAQGAYNVSNTFVQVGQAERMPWNYYYWPMKSDAIHEPWSGGNGRVDTYQVMGDDILVARPGAPIAPGEDIVRAGPNGILETPPAPGDELTWFPNLYDDLSFRGADGNIYQTPAPLLKYDQLFNTSARAWEAANSQNQDIQRWPGHCLGGAVASIVLNEPVPAPNSGLSQDELKALWAELGENHYNHQIGDHVNDIPAGPPRPGPDPTDRFVARFHAVLEEHIRGRRKALLGNLRAFPPRGTANEVWNHGVGKYVASLQAIPGRGERSVRVKLELIGNNGAVLASSTDTNPRVNTYEYTLVYGMNGRVDETNVANNDWIAVGGEALFAPLNLMEVSMSRWQGHNPYVNETNVRSLDVANRGNVPAFNRFASPPQFQPAAVYEYGRPRPAPGPGFNSSGGNNNNNRRRGLFGLFGGN